MAIAEPDGEDTVTGEAAEVDILMRAGGEPEDDAAVSRPDGIERLGVERLGIERIGRVVERGVAEGIEFGAAGGVEAVYQPAGPLGIGWELGVDGEQVNVNAGYLSQEREEGTDPGRRWMAIEDNSDTKRRSSAGQGFPVG